MGMEVANPDIKRIIELQTKGTLTDEEHKELDRLEQKNVELIKEKIAKAQDTVSNAKDVSKPDGMSDKQHKKNLNLRYKELQAAWKEIKILKVEIRQVMAVCKATKLKLVKKHAPK